MHALAAISTERLLALPIIDILGFYHHCCQQWCCHFCHFCSCSYSPSGSHIRCVCDLIDLLFCVEIAPPDPFDVLPRDKCEEALRAARQARWFEVSGFHSSDDTGESYYMI